MFNTKQNSLKLLLLSATTTSLLQANISGIVYKDFNMNGVKDANDAPVIGVTVNATCEDGNSYVATTNTTGAYTLSGFPAGNKCRVEANTVSAGVGSGTNALGSAPLVDIVTDGATHNISAGSPATYCQDDPDVVMAALPGWHTSGVSRCAPNSLGNGTCRTEDFGTLFKVTTPVVGSFNANGTIPAERTTLTTFTQTGAVWGAAWKKGTKDLFIAANLKRYVPLGNTAGTIYKVDVSGGNALTTFVTVPNATNAAADTIIAARTYGYNQDVAIKGIVGKQGLGDLDINEEETELYTINMNTKELVEINIATQAINTIAIPNPYGANCPDADVRPWAIKTRGADVFIGSVCASEIENDLGAAIQKYNGAIITTIAQTNSLRYTKPRGYSPASGVTSDTKYRNWGTSSLSAPILTDLEFTNSGDLVLGYTNLAAYNQDATLNGDIRKMCLNVDGTYTDESSDVAVTTCASHVVNYGLPESYYEFYIGDYFGADLGKKGHPETASGSLAMAPGAPNIIVGMIDGTDWNQAGAIGLYDNISGDKIGAQALLDNRRVVNGGEREPYGAKSGGMGDVELLCDAAPIEVGNLVWLDTNLDGIQDPNESGIAGVTVTLACNGTDIGSVATDSTGHYYFGGLTNANLTGANTITAGTPCTLRITQSSVNSKPPTIQDPNGNNEDQHDNDAVASGADNVITFTTTVANNHSLDFGITPTVGCATGTLFQDINNDGLKDVGDTLAGAGIALVITDDFGGTYNTTTDANGQFSVQNVAAGDINITIDTTDTDITDGAIWASSLVSLTLSEGSTANIATCSTVDFPYTLPAPLDQDPKDTATCANPTSITWNGATVSTNTPWGTPAVNVVRTIPTAGGNQVSVNMKIINDNDGEYNQGETGTGGAAAFGQPYLTLYLGDQANPGDGNWQNSDNAGCSAHGYDLEAGESYDLEVVFSEPVILDNWRIRDVDSGDIRGGTPNWNWQDGIKAEAFDANGAPIAIESKIGSSGLGLIKDANNIVHTDAATYNGGAVAVGAGSTPNATNGHIVLTSNFVPIKKLVITHVAGPDVPCQTRSALALAGLAVCKPLHISGTVYDDQDGSRGICATAGTSIDGTPISTVEGNQLHACLVDYRYIVLDTQDISATGEYDFDSYVLPGTEYNILVTTAPCIVGASAPQGKLPAGWVYEDEETNFSPDGDYDGMTTITSGSANVTGIDFSINKVPVSLDYTRTAELNPNGATFVTFDNKNEVMLNLISDFEETTPNTIKIVTLPTGSVVRYSGAAITPNQLIANPDISLFDVDPIDGDVTTSFSYVSIDKACRESESAVFKAQFTTLQINGKLFLDTTPDGNVNGAGTGKSCDGTTDIFVNLIDASANVVSSSILANDGTYAFYYADGVRKNTDYTVELSTTLGTVGATVPALAIPATCATLDGENIESLTPNANDGTPDGKIAVEVDLLDVEEVNFAIGLKSVLVPPPPAAPAPVAPAVAGKGCLGDRVWIDVNRDGIQDSNEIGISNIDVTLFDADGTTVLQTTKTDANGIYLFSDLDGGQYCVGFSGVPAGYVVTKKDQGNDDNQDSDVNVDTNKTDKFVLRVARDCNTSFDMGIYEDKAIVISDDEVEANTKGPKTVINVLDNDEVDEGSTIYIVNNNGEEVQTLVVPGEGIWEVVGGTIVFTAKDGFSGVPTPIKYIVRTKVGGVSNIASVSIVTACTCETYKESSVAALNIWTMLLLVFGSSMFAFFFAREELEVK